MVMYREKESTSSDFHNEFYVIVPLSCRKGKQFEFIVETCSIVAYAIKFVSMDSSISSLCTSKQGREDTISWYITRNNSVIQQQCSTVSVH